MQGWRANQEDTHLLIPTIPSKPSCSLFAVFDGHGGAATSAAVRDRLVYHISATDGWRREGESPAALGAALREGFAAMDAELRGRGFPCGCTAVVTVVTPTHIVCANAGDSRALGAMLDGGLLWETKDHKPTDPAEEARIRAAGGMVAMGRVNGDLALSRALGDFSFKARRGGGQGGWAPAEQQQVSSCPDIYITPRSEEDGCLVLACDGLWDVMSSKEVAAASSLVRPLRFVFFPRALSPNAHP